MAGRFCIRFLVEAILWCRGVKTSIINTNLLVFTATKPTIVTDVNSAANKERMRDFLGDKALEARTLHDNLQQQREQIENQIALEQKEQEDNY